MKTKRTAPICTTNHHEFIELEVRYNHELYNAILSLGKDCVVLEPTDLRETIQGLLREALSGYDE